MNTQHNNGRGASAMTPGVDRLVSKREAADMLSVSVRTVERDVSAGKLTIQKVRGCVRLRLSQVMQLAGIQSELNTSQL